MKRLINSTSKIFLSTLLFSLLISSCSVVDDDITGVNNGVDGDPMVIKDKKDEK